MANGRGGGVGHWGTRGDPNNGHRYMVIFWLSSAILANFCLSGQSGQFRSFWSKSCCFFNKFRPLLAKKWPKVVFLVNFSSFWPSLVDLAVFFCYLSNVTNHWKQTLCVNWAVGHKDIYGHIDLFTVAMLRREMKWSSQHLYKKKLLKNAEANQHHLGKYDIGRGGSLDRGGAQKLENLPHFRDFENVDF